MKKEISNLLTVRIIQNNCKGYIPSRYKITKWAKIARVTEAWEDATESYEEFRIIY